MSRLKVRIRFFRRLLRGRFYFFFNWWLSELAIFLPRQYRSALTNREQNILIDLNGHEGQVKLSRSSGGGDKTASIDLMDNSSDKQAQFYKDIGPMNKVTEVTLRLDPKKVLNTVLTFPLATEENLADVLAFEMDRKTPFSADQVYFGFRVIKRDVENHLLHVNLAVIMRQELSHVMEKINAYDLTPTIVEVANTRDSGDEGDDYIALNLNPQDRRGRARAKRSWRPQLVVTAVIFMIVASLISIMKKDSIINDLKQQEKGLKDIALAAQSMRDEIDQYVTQGMFFLKKREQEPALAELLGAVTELLPDGTWLKHFEYSGHQVKIQGESDNASALIGLMERSPYFTDTSFTSPVTRNPRTERDMFLIITTVTINKELP